MMISCTGNPRLTVTNLKCEYLENPLGMDKPLPRFSWYISSNQRGILQSAYQIIVSDAPEDISKGIGKIWDSGKISQISQRIWNIKVLRFRADKSYYWNVIVWDQKGEQSSESKSALFHTGLYNPTDWEAKWISAGDTTLSAPLIRKDSKLVNR